MKSLPLVFLAVLLAACGVRAPDQSAGSARVMTPPPQPPVPVRPPAAAAQTPCDVKAGDSAYAVCWAMRPDRAGDPPRRVFEVVRRADTVCVTTLPGDPRVLDGMRRTRVLFTAVLENIESDSIGCR